MPGSRLVNLKTNLKSLKYGHDRQGDGSSEQPYITTNIPNRLSTSPTDDGYIRGGWTLANQASITDQLRISKFINDTPKGPLFIQRQIGLQLTNPKIETRKINLNSFGLLGNILTSAFNVFNDLTPGPTRLYNEGKNTLSQLPLTAFGTHFERHGLSPIQDDNTKYLAVVRNNNDNGNNRLLALKTKLIKPGITNPRAGNVILGTANAILGAVNVFNTVIGRGTNPLLPTSPLLQPADLIIDRYSGGPGSTYGVGFTTIRRYDVTSNGSNKPIPSKGLIDYAGALGVSDTYFSREDNFNKNHIAGTGKPSQIDQTAVNYGSNAYPAGAFPSSISPSTRAYDKLRTQVEKQSNITQVTNNGNSKFVTSTATQNINKNSNLKTLLKDVFNRIDENILSIMFKIVNPFNPTEETITLSAYMKGFRDNFDGTWNEYNYIGRSESFYTYGKFKRNVSFNLDIPCFKKADLLKNYQKLGQLASTTAGAYNENGLLGGVMIRLTVGNHLNGDYGLLNSLSYEIPDDSAWDIDEKLAMYIKATFNFTIVHANLPKYTSNSYFNSGPAALNIESNQQQAKTRDLLRQGSPTVPFFENNTIDTTTTFNSNLA